MEGKRKLNELDFVYTFHFEEENSKEFSFCLEPNTLNIINLGEEDPPEWAKLEKFKCDNCTLDTNCNEYCPLAKKLSSVIEFFSDFPSFSKASVYVENYERVTYKHTTVQLGVGSLMGMVMASSGCPIVGKLKPLVKFHLPFSSLEETEYRVLAMYVLSQFFKYRRTGEADWNLDNLKKGYEEIQKVNRNIVNKLSDVEMSDASRNAVVTLSNFAEFILLSLETLDQSELINYLKEIEDF